MRLSPKKIVLGILLVVTLALVYAVATHRWLFGHAGRVKATSTNAGRERKVLFWYDAMDPQHHYNQPGKAPDGMDLVPQYAEQTAPPAGQTSSSPSSSMAKMPMGTVTISPEKQVLAGVRTGIVERKPLVRDIRTTAQIVVDDTRIAHIHVKVAGYIDKVYVDFVG
ncbi:MAG TPA: heavy metal-binding domain-containing protein, partial [Edaphobacter sp.]|uniref:heavy metal-binding domain-containing protein n=1 Tax=Edaphobacter sp. TaxID=1934404 RepID=UPI002D1A50BA